MPKIGLFGAIEGVDHNHASSEAGAFNQQHDWLRRVRRQQIAEPATLTLGSPTRSSRHAQASAFLHSRYVKDLVDAKPQTPGSDFFRSWRLSIAGGDSAEAASTKEPGPEIGLLAHRDGFIRMNDLALIAGFLGVSALVGLGYRALMTPTPLQKAPPRRGENQQQTSVPDAATAAALKIDPPEYPEDKLIILSDRGHNPAAAERLVRNIMTVDGCDHDVATTKVAEIDTFHRNAVQRTIWMYFVGIGMASFSAFAAFPLVYSQGLTELTGLSIVSTDVPEPLEVHNMFKVSNWSWGWMEPLTGAASFIALMWQLKKQWADEIGVLDSYHAGKSLAVNGDGVTVLKKYTTYDREALKTFVLTTVNHEEPMMKDID
mmetsp:Transcript_59112/g.132418  ORF Transcript_59112/g.132418 Transcript_59112/m.132418 type:complete len:374 (-) Transcript_59112:43-1164(-)